MRDDQYACLCICLGLILGLAAGTSYNFSSLSHDVAELKKDWQNSEVCLK